MESVLFALNFIIANHAARLVHIVMFVLTVLIHKVECAIYVLLFPIALIASMIQNNVLYVLLITSLIIKQNVLYVQHYLNVNNVNLLDNFVPNVMLVIIPTMMEFVKLAPQFLAV